MQARTQARTSASAALARRRLWRPLGFQQHELSQRTGPWAALARLVAHAHQLLHGGRSRRRECHRLRLSDHRLVHGQWARAAGRRYRQCKRHR